MAVGGFLVLICKNNIQQCIKLTSEQFHILKFHIGVTIDINKIYISQLSDGIVTCVVI